MNGALNEHLKVQHPKPAGVIALLRDHTNRPAIGGDTSNQITDFH